MRNERLAESLILALALVLLLMPLSKAISQGNAQCEMQLVYRPHNQGLNEVLIQHYDGVNWSDADLVHSTASSFSYSPTIAADANGKLLVVWVEARGESSQLMYRVKSDTGKWIGKPTELTSAKGEKTTPILIRSISGEIYLAWVSDQNDFDDVFFSSWNFANGWSKEAVLSLDNSFPDITPNFEYTQDINGTYQLILKWQARSKDGFYAPEQYVVETGLELEQEQQSISQHCEKALSTVNLPSNVEEGFLNLTPIILDSYQRITSR